MESLSMIKGRIVLVPFPFDDLSSIKVRPAVCLTEPVGPHRHIVLAFITSRVPSDLEESDLLLDSSHPNFPHTGLRVSSTIRTHRMMTVARGLIQRELGQLPPTWHDQMNIRLLKLFGLDGRALPSKR